MPDPHVAIESLEDGLRIAVAPLVHGMDDLEFERIDEDNGRRAFRAALKDPARIASRAGRVVRRASRLACDVVIFPELCLAPKGQQLVKDVLARSVRRANGRPWLIVAGTAQTPCSSGGHHNRALVLDTSGNEVLAHNKLFPYEMSRREETRYGIGEALLEEPRVEDIVVEPRSLEILECPLGRVAVLICEDLSNTTLFAPVVQDFEIDWLLVPVMDGVQNLERWTAKYSARFADDFGTSVLVATCGALVSAHRQDLKKAGKPDPGEGVGLFTQRGAWDAKTEVMIPHADHVSMAIFDISA
jgi:predicted amidohydrolase